MKKICNFVLGKLFFLKTFFHQTLVEPMKKLLLSIAASLLCTVSYAEWTMPKTPTAQAFTTGETFYLYNLEARAFFVGANDWGTRASVSPSMGHKIIIESGTLSNSYYITNFVLQGSMANQWGCAFIDESEKIWVDNTKTGKTENQFTFKHYGDNQYRICLSDANTIFKYTDYEDVYLGLGSNEEDTRLYLCDLTDYNRYPEAECKLTWIFVTPADYEAFAPKNEVYLAAMALKKAIEEAKSVNADTNAIIDAETRYANESSTTEELNAATEALRIAIDYAKLLAASVDKPVDALPFLGIATDFNDDNESGWTSTTGAQNKGASNGNNALSFAETGNHYENWSKEAFTPGKISATATNLPPGVYQLNALAFTATGKGTYLYAGNARTHVTSKKINKRENYDCYAVVANGTLEIGLDIPEQNTNWVGLDNVHLYYLGNTPEAYAIVNGKLDETEVDYEGEHEDGKTAFQMSVYNKYAEAKNAFISARDKTGEEYAAAYDALLIAREDMKKSVEAYAPFVGKYKEADEWLKSTVAEGEDIDIFYDYICDEIEPEAGKFNDNGSALYIIRNGLLTTEQIATELDYLSGILSNAMAGNMKDGDDCTELIANPNFTELGGWNSAASVEWPLGGDDFKVFQAWGCVCDVHQSIYDIQNGVYEMELQTVYKPDNDEAIRQTYAYINDFYTKIGVTTEENPVQSVNDASDMFKDGKYTVKAYGLVTNNTLRLGIANRLRTGENGVLWAGGVKLTYRAKNAEVCASLCQYLTELADEVIEDDFGKDETRNLSEAVTNAAGASGGEGYNALVQLKAALDDANRGIELYKNLYVAIEKLKEALEKNSADATTLAYATELFNTAKAAYEDKSYNNETAENAITELKTATVSLKTGGVQASEENPTDCTSVIVNNDFDPTKGNKDEKRIDGWEVEGALTAYKAYTCTFDKGTFHLSQELVGLEEGTYLVTVHAYYRAGSYEEEEANINAGKDTHLMMLYANSSDNTYEKAVMNLSEGSLNVSLPEEISTKTINGITVPDGVGASVKCFKKGLFLNELAFHVDDTGCATIGLRLDKTIGTNDNAVVGEWNLFYYGNGDKVVTLTNMDEVEAGSTVFPVAYFTASGMRIASPQTGLNIIKMSDGSVVKVMIRK